MLCGRSRITALGSFSGIVKGSAGNDVTGTVPLRGPDAVAPNGDGDSIAGYAEGSGGGGSGAAGAWGVKDGAVGVEGLLNSSPEGCEFLEGSSASGTGQGCGRVKVVGGSGDWGLPVSAGLNGV